MKILIATGLYPPEIGGPATYTKMLEEHLPQHGIQLTVVPFGQVRKYPKIIRHLMYMKALWQKSSDTDIIYALDPISVGVPARVVSFLRRQPFMLRLGGDYAWEQGKQRFGVTVNLDEFSDRPNAFGIRTTLLAWIQSLISKQAKAVVVPSQYLASIVAKWGVSRSHIHVIYSALFPLPVLEDRESLRAKLSYTFPTIVSAGRLVPWKGFEQLIEVVNKLQADYPDISLVISGDGPDEKRLRELIAQHGLETQVRLLGNVSKEALGGVIHAADVFVLNTGYEGLSHQLLEVMEIGTPIVTTNVGGNPELIKHEETGLIVEYNDREALVASLRRLLKDTDLRNKLIARAKEQVEEFRKEKVINDIVILLTTIYEQR